MAAPLTRAGRYQIVSELGRGSMGVVYQGFDPVIGRTVAIKTMLTEGLAPAEFEDFKARFQREAQAAGVLNHPSIVTVYDFGEDHGVLYLAMEFLEGKSLQQIVEEEGVLPPERIIPIYDQVCEALDLAHSHNIIHRDVKPANIMILQSGLVKMTDFGIAKMLSTGMTQAGQILGTPNYMSPEQVRGRQIDGRSDLFSLGVILYELVTGEKPFGGQNITTVIYKIINENPIPPRELDSSIHPGLSYVIQKSLAKSPDERYQTCRELAEDLKNYKKLGGAVAPSETVVVRVPPLAATGAESRQAPTVKPRPAYPPPGQAPVTAGEQPITRPVSIQVIPPVQAATPKSSSASLFLLLLLLLAGGGAGYYYFFIMRPQATQVASVPVQPSSVPTPQPTVDPTQPGGEATPPEPEGGGGDAIVTTPGAPATDIASGTSTTSPPLGQPAESAPKSGTGPTATSVEPKPAPATSGARVAPQPGSLAVSSNVPGAQITVDGKSDPAWVTPFTVPNLSPGMHSIAVTKEGYTTAQRNVTIEAGRATSLNVALGAPVGEVNIVTTPPGIDVLIDGQPAGKTPFQKSAGLGKHTFTLQAPGMDPYTSTFEIKYDGYIVTKRIDLSGAVAASTGVVEIRTAPPGATVTTGGKAVGSTTPTSIRLPAGRHMLSLSLEGYQTLHVGVDVPSDGNVTLNERLKAQ
jgi:serine/threonine-protein kinase